MALYDRDYYREEKGPHPLSRLPQTTVGLIILVTVGVWILELLAGPPFRDLLAASARDLGRLLIWQPLTAVFTHDDESIWHLIWNMLFLHFFGRELEQIYGRRGFLVFYLVAGVASILAEVVSLWLGGQPDRKVLGASGAVLGVVVLFTLYYPQRQILFLFIPMPVWVLSLVFIAADLAGALGVGGGGVANVAHLTGAAVGFFYWYLGIQTRRWGGLRALWRRRPRVRRKPAPIIHMPARGDAVTRDISERIDALLAKISAQGKESLTEEEWDFLRNNSSRYRS